MHVIEMKLQVINGIRDVKIPSWYTAMNNLLKD